MGVTMRAVSDSVLSVGILHQIFDANNNGALSIPNGGRRCRNMTQLAAVTAGLIFKRAGYKQSLNPTTCSDAPWKSVVAQSRSR